MDKRRRQQLAKANRRYRARLKRERYGPEGVSVDHRGRHGNGPRGPANKAWRGGVYKTPQGYICVPVPVGHHLRQAHGYAYEHQLVMEEKLGRLLLPGETVHHLNGRRDDNRPENLEVRERREHARRHAQAPNARDFKGRFTAGGPRIFPCEVKT